ncbi:uncharacterized [Tachysurus ichikawai]
MRDSLGGLCPHLSISPFCSRRPRQREILCPLTVLQPVQLYTIYLPVSIIQPSFSTVSGVGHQVHRLLVSAHVALLAQFPAVSLGADYSAPEPADFGAPAGGKSLKTDNERERDGVGRSRAIAFFGLNSEFCGGLTVGMNHSAMATESSVATPLRNQTQQQPRLGQRTDKIVTRTDLETQHVAKDPEALWSAAATLDRISRSTSKSFKGEPRTMHGEVFLIKQSMGILHVITFDTAESKEQNEKVLL